MTSCWLNACISHSPLALPFHLSFSSCADSVCLNYICIVRCNVHFAFRNVLRFEVSFFPRRLSLSSPKSRKPVLHFYFYFSFHFQFRRCFYFFFIRPCYGYNLSGYEVRLGLRISPTVRAALKYCAGKALRIVLSLLHVAGCSS